MSNKKVINPIGLNLRHKKYIYTIRRGGCLGTGNKYTRSAFRFPISRLMSNLGFRICITKK